MMKKVLLMLILFVGIASCSVFMNAAQTKKPAKDRVEIIYFHGKQRCATCMAIERLTKEVISKSFAKEVRNGTLVLKVVDISTRTGEALADKYEMSWSSLFVNKWKGGRETRSNLTQFAFGNAKNNPSAFKKGLENKILQMLR